MSTRVAVLGAGIMGCCVALLLARRGGPVDLFDEAAAPFCGASRWNEGKIHLGYIYAADPSLRTAGHVQPGGLLFRPMVESLLGLSLAGVTSQADDIYLCRRDSVVPPDAMAAYVARVNEQVRAHPDARHYLQDARYSRTHRLSPTELAAVTDSPDILAGFRVPERSVATLWLADQFVAAVAAEPHITLHRHTAVTAARPHGDSPDGLWMVESGTTRFGPYRHVVNALWQGRLAIDQSAGLAPQGVWSHRYRQSLFLRTTQALDTPCVVIATGPFGDIKNYNGRDFYLSWYPAGLRVDSRDLVPPPPSALDMPPDATLAQTILDQLQAQLPWVQQIRAHAEHMAIGGGWVFAAGRGALSDPASGLHRRSDYGVQRRGAYVSVDTGKYSTAPWQAHLLVDALG